MSSKLFFLIFTLTTCISCSSEKIKRETINLGETAWRFKKVDNIKPVDISGQAKKTDSEDGKTITFEFDKEVSIKSLDIVLHNPDIYRILYTIEGKTSDGDWKIIKKKSGHGEKVKVEEEAYVGDAGDSFGLIKEYRYSYISEVLQSNYREVRITLDKASAKSGTIDKKTTFDIKLYQAITNNSSKRFSTHTFDDSDWEEVAIPHCFNDNDTYLNAKEMQMWRGEVWYRKQIQIAKSSANKRTIIEFQGVNIGAALYVNGTFIPGSSKVKQPDEVTHVGGFLPFAIDITKYLKFGELNTIAVRVSNQFDGFFTDPGFGTEQGFGMGWGGVVAPVYMHTVDPVHIPLNVYAPEKKWGTYFACVSANKNLAKVKSLTNVENSSDTPHKVKLITKLYNDDDELVAEKESEANIDGGKSHIFSQSIDIKNPELWYPNDSLLNRPSLYRVEHIVISDNREVDQISYRTGVRKIEWDDNFCYVNGKKTFLRGFGHRNSYPALGSAVPTQLQYRDVALIADAGANTLRVGHVPATKIMVEACDQYGVMVFQNSGDNEWVLKEQPALTYKAEYDREMMVAFRNNPSIAVWESNNGLPFHGGNIYDPINTHNIAMEWDSLQPRIIHNRDRYPKRWPDSLKVMVGYTNRFKKVKGSPSINTEVYGAYWDGRRSWNIARFDYENEVAFTDFYVQDYLDDIDSLAAGWIDWMLAETQGEGYTTYLNGKKNQKSLGSSALDGNRIAKLKYRVYRDALWVDYNRRPGVTLQSSWNLSGVQDISVWSNCPKVELFLNGTTLGVLTPDKRTKKVVWKNIQWEAGTIKAVGLNSDGEAVCKDSRTTSTAPHSIKLSIDSTLVTPQGEKLYSKADGSDVVIVTAKIVDAAGELCVDADNNIEFSCEGPATFKGSYNFYVQPNSTINQYAPGATILKAEGGVIKVAIRSTFNAGEITISAKSDQIKQDTIKFKTK